MEKVTTMGIDLAKSVFSLHGVDGAGRVVLRRTVRRDQLLGAVAALPPCLIGMEACSGAHEWGRRFQELGHTVRLMAPKFVAPYRKSGKNDGNDAEAICEAVTRPSMRFVPDDRTTAGRASVRAHLLDRVRDAIARRHYSRRTEETYVRWIKRFIHFHGTRHPCELGETEVTAFLNHLGRDRDVAASTQN